MKWLLVCFLSILSVSAAAQEKRNKRQSSKLYRREIALELLGRQLMHYLCNNDRPRGHAIEESVFVFEVDKHGKVFDCYVAGDFDTTHANFKLLNQLEATHFSKWRGKIFSNMYVLVPIVRYEQEEETGWSRPNVDWMALCQQLGFGFMDLSIAITSQLSYKPAEEGHGTGSFGSNATMRFADY